MLIYKLSKRQKILDLKFFIENLPNIKKLIFINKIIFYYFVKATYLHKYTNNQSIHFSLIINIQYINKFNNKLSQKYMCSIS